MRGCERAWRRGRREKTGLGQKRRGVDGEQEGRGVWVDPLVALVSARD